MARSLVRRGRGHLKPAGRHPIPHHPRRRRASLHAFPPLGRGPWRITLPRRTSRPEISRRSSRATPRGSPPHHDSTRATPEATDAGSTGNASVGSHPNATTNLSATSHQSPARSDAGNRGHARDTAHTNAAHSAPCHDARHNPEDTQSVNMLLPLPLLRAQPRHDVLELRQLLVGHVLGLGQVRGER